MDLELLACTAAEIARAVNAGERSAREITEATLAHVDEVEGQVGSYLTVLHEMARERALEVDRHVRDGKRLPLAGVPIAVKDNMCLRDTRTTCASKILEEWIAPYTATAVTRLLDAGCVPIGKANCDEFAMGSSCENSALGVTRNPYDLRRVPGGSSGGPAAAVAAYEAAIGMGSDTGGSIREPAAFCNLVGFKPTYGRISRYGLIAFASSLDQIGPLTRTVEDAALAYDAMGGHDPMDATSAQRPLETAANAMLTDLRGLRVGIVREFDTKPLGDAADRIYKQAYRDLEALGAIPVEVSLPTADYGLATYYLIAPAECSSNLARFDGVRYGLRVDAPDVRTMYERTRAAGFGPEVKRRILIGTYALSSGYYDAYYVRAQKARTLIARDFENAFASLRRDRVPRRQLRGVRVQREERPVQHVPDGLLHDSDVARGTAGAFGAVRLGHARGRRAADADRLAAVRAALRRAASARRRTRVRASHEARLCTRAGVGRDDGRRMTYEAVIGIECHVELKTETKMFCGCRNEFGGEPNTKVCPVCLGMPGALPVPNARAIDAMIAAGVAFGSKIATFSKFDRKNYFYPDMPKDYQISQYDMPLTLGGEVAYWLSDGTMKACRLTRIHLEEDTGKSTHAGSGDGRIAGSSYTLVDFNRAGVPLMECVSEPELHSAADAVAYLESLRRTLLQLGVSDVKMEEGSLRCDANVSVRPAGASELGTKTEIKNMNSFRSVERAIESEIERQIALLEAGERIVQETRGWDEVNGVTHSMRSKEEAHDYRYFPDPDLVPLELVAATVERVRGTLPELPWQRFERYTKAYALSAAHATQLVDNLGLATYFDRTVELGANPPQVANLLLGDLSRLANESGTAVAESHVRPDHLAELVALVDAKTINSKIAKELLARMWEGAGSPKEIVAREGLAQTSDPDAIARLVDEVIGANEKVVADYRAGKSNVLGFLVGQAMKASRGKADPALVNELMRKKLGVS